MLFRPVYKFYVFYSILLSKFEWLLQIEHIFFGNIQKLFANKIEEYFVWKFIEFDNKICSSNIILVPNNSVRNKYRFQQIINSPSMLFAIFAITCRSTHIDFVFRVIFVWKYLRRWIIYWNSLQSKDYNFNFVRNSLQVSTFIQINMIDMNNNSSRHAVILSDPISQHSFRLTRK